MPIGAVLRGEKYRIIKILGSGGFGITYLAEHILLGSWLVIKEYFPSERGKRLPDGSEVLPHAAHRELFERGMRHFFREAQFLHQFKHPNIVPVNDLFEANGTAYFVMKHIDGQTFSDYLQHHPQPDCDELCTIFSPLLDALEYLHNQNILHRDIKPQNILLAGNIPVLIDFDAARQAVSGQYGKDTFTFVSDGFAPYEQYIGETSVVSDIYSLSACLYQAVTGKLPPSALVRKAKPEQLVILADNREYCRRYPQAWLKVIDKGFSQDKGQRYQSIKEMRKAWQAALAEQGSRSSQSAAEPTSWKWGHGIGKFVDLCAEMGKGIYQKHSQASGQAFAQFEPAAETKTSTVPDAVAMKFLYERADNGDTQAYEQLEMLAKKGIADAQNYLGCVYEMKYLFTKQDTDEARQLIKQWSQKAEEWYLKAAEQEHADAQNNLGMMYFYLDAFNLIFRNKYTRKNAAKWYSKAAEQGYAPAQYHLGLMYMIGDGGVGQNKNRAVEWCRKAAEQGYADAQNNLAMMYTVGYGVAQDQEQAAEWYRKAIEQGHIEAQLNFELMYENGSGLAADKIGTPKRRHASSLHYLGAMHKGRDRCERYDKNKPIEWHRQAAEQGHAGAQKYLGDVYRGWEQEKLQKDLKQAAEWYRKAAEQGHADAQICLADMYADRYKERDGIAQDYEKAAKWYLTALATGSANMPWMAAEQLGDMYEKGLGVKKDYKEAVRWYGIHWKLWYFCIKEGIHEDFTRICRGNLASSIQSMSFVESSKNAELRIAGTQNILGHEDF